MTNNRLASSTSPYLQQHADNPVDWHPWDEAALAAAREQDKPILLSIGYSACHWCHVMAHESFEDDATAELMNRLFINIKVDREERPDLDKIYQTAHQIMNQAGGGWPLTVFLTPQQHVPFFAGTYFPPKAAYGRPSFRELLLAIDNAWRTRRADIEEQNSMLLQALSDENKTAGNQAQLNELPLQRAFQALQHSFSEPRGGFSGAPKFPHTDMLNALLLHAWRESDEKQVQAALHMAHTTASCMALGGINDQLGGGFCRYSTDADWQIPHFEKMLYDNGPLLAFYVDLYQLSGNDLYKQTATMTADWVLSEMQAPHGGYYSSLDADSEGHEGRYYVWTREEVQRLLNDEEYDLLAQRFGLDQPANFEGAWHLHCDALQQPAVLSAAQQSVWDTARDKLLAARKLRVRPGLDDKQLTSWNALMIKGMLRAADVLHRGDWLDSATRAIEFIRDQLWRDGRLLAVHKDGVSHLNAYLDDYAYLLDALLEYLTVRWSSDYLQFARQLADVLLAHYQDQQQGGFFFTSDEHEKLIQRPKPYMDDAMPSGNGIAAKALLRLGYLLGDTDYLQAAEQTLQSAWPALLQYPHAHCSLLAALEEYLQPPEIFIIRGSTVELSTWRAALLSDYQPHRLVLTIDANETDLPGALADKKPAGQAVAYRCKGMTCFAPITDLQQL
ncbi:MAG: thioredoxin domain-containing protein [Chromatiales bacterium]|jgi:uncharacterized protein YyaL (SSP411 family)